MKKFHLIFGLFIVFALMLSACDAGSADENDNGATIQETDDSLTDETQDLQESENEEPEGTPAAGDADVVPVTGAMDDASRISKLLDFDVIDANNEDIGDVEDIILNIDNEQIQYVIIEVGGFLGLGAKEVAVPFDQLQVIGDLDDDDIVNDNTNTQVTPEGQDNQNNTVDDEDLDNDLDRENVFILNVTKEQLENAPDFDRDAFPELGETALEDWDVDYRGFWSGDMTAAPQDQAVTPEAEVTAETEVEAETVRQVQGVVLATELLGMTIEDQEENNIATIEDVIVDPQSGNVRYVVVDITGIDGLEDQLMLIPLGAISWSYSADKEVLVVDDTQILTNAPTFDDDALDDGWDDTWFDEVDTYWQAEVQS